MERLKRRELFRRAGWGLSALAASQVLHGLSLPGPTYAQAKIGRASCRERV